MKLLYSTSIILLLSVWPSSHSIYGQELFAKIPAKNSTAINIITFDYGDSLFLKIGSIKYSISQSGTATQSTHKIFDKSGNSATEVIKYGKDYYTYYLASSNENPFIAVERNNNPSTSKHFQLIGEILSIFKHINLYALTFEKKGNQLRIIEIEKDQIKNEITFQLPFDLTEFKLEEVQYIQPKHHVLLSEATSRLKIFVENDKVILVTDEPYQRSFDEANKIAKTMVCTFNLNSDEVQIRSLLESSHSDFRSYYLDGFIYRILIGGRKLELKVFDPNDQQVSYFFIDQSPQLKKQKIYLREGTANLVSKEESLQGLIKSASAYSSKLFLVVENNSENKPYVTWGTYYNGKGMAAPTLGLPTMPFSYFAIAALRTAHKQSQEGPGISQYFYLSEDDGGNFQITKDEMSFPRAKIDAYEMSQEKKELKFKLKGYANFGSKTLGIYQYHKKDSIEIINFGDLYK